MDAIPEDVMYEAKKALEGRRIAFDNETGPRALTEAIARAILAERERCAKIVTEWQKQLVRGERIDWHVDRIVAAIRATP